MQDKHFLLEHTVIPVLLQVLKVKGNLQRMNKMPDKDKFVRDIRDNGAESLLVYQVLSEKNKGGTTCFCKQA